MFSKAFGQLEQFGKLETKSSLGLGIQAFEVWFSFKLTKFLYGTLDHGKTVKNWNNPMLQKLLNMSLKETYQFLLLLKEYSIRMKQLIALPNIEVVEDESE